MASRTLVRVLFVKNQQFFHQIKPCQSEANARKLCLDSANGCLSNRHYSVFSDFYGRIKDEARSNKEFQKSIKQLQQKVHQLKRASTELDKRILQTAERLSKDVDCAWDDAQATARKISLAFQAKKEFQLFIKLHKEKVEQLQGATEEFDKRLQWTAELLVKHVDGLWNKAGAAARKVKETFWIWKPESPSPNGTLQLSLAFNGTHSKDGSKTEHNQNPELRLSDVAEALFGILKSIFSSTILMVSFGFQKLKELEEVKAFDMVKKGYQVVKNDLTGKSSKRKWSEYAASSFSGKTSARAEIFFVPSTQTTWRKIWEMFMQKMQGHPIFKCIWMMSEPVLTKTKECAEDLQDMWETTENPVVHKIVYLNARIFGENDAAMTFKEIRMRDPFFSLTEFVAEVEEVIKPILNAYVKGNFEVLRKYCCPEMIQKCEAVHKGYGRRGVVLDTKILHVDEVVVEEAKMMGETPIIILTFETQQVHCFRDNDGSVKEGSNDTIHREYYEWAMEQQEPEAAGKKDAIYCLWRLREMQQSGVTAFI